MPFWSIRKTQLDDARPQHAVPDTAYAALGKAKKRNMVKKVLKELKKRLT